MQISSLLKRIVGSKHALKITPSSLVIMGQTVIEQVTKTKWIGIIVDIKITWNRQADQILTKMGWRMNHKTLEEIHA